MFFKNSLFKKIYIFIRKIKTHNFATGSKYVIERFNLDEKPEVIAKEWFVMAVQAYADDLDL